MAFPHIFYHTIETDKQSQLFHSHSVQFGVFHAPQKPTPTKYLIDWCGFVGLYRFPKFYMRSKSLHHSNIFSPKNIKFQLQVRNFSDEPYHIKLIYIYIFAAMCYLQFAKQLITFISENMSRLL